MAQKEKRRKFSFLVTSLAGSSLPHFTRTLASHSSDFRYFSRTALTWIVAMILEPFRWWEYMRWNRKINKVKIDTPPIFIIGFWRSGTTMLHNIMCQDPRASYVTTYQTVFPNHLFSHSWWFKPIIGLFWPTHRPFDDVKMGLDLPQEEEIALASLQTVSFYNFLYFPKNFERSYEEELFLRGLSKSRLRKWKKAYIRLIKQSILNRKGDRFVSKNPSNMARIRILLDMFPDAKFIFIHRDPYKTVYSFYRFFAEVVPTIELQKSDHGLDIEKHVRVYKDLLHQYFREKSLIPEGNLVEVRFDDFKKDPLAGLEQIYSRLGLDGFKEARSYFEKYQESSGEINHKYEIPKETIELVNREAGDVIKMLGYQIRA
jgi:hypothetical protein